MGGLRDYLIVFNQVMDFFEEIMLFLYESPCYCYRVLLKMNGI
jgi:hypothetical protein